MRISRLSERTGIPVATIKYYLREGLLHPGTAVTPRLTDYDESHVDRLRLLRTLREVARLPIARLKALTAAVESRATLHEAMGEVADALAPAARPPGEHHAVGRRQAERLVSEAGWQLRPGTPDLEHLAGVLETFVELTGRTVPPDIVASYIEAADGLGRRDIEAMSLSHGVSGALRQMVLGQVVLGELLAVLRRLAEESYSNKRFGAAATGPD